MTLRGHFSVFYFERLSHCGLSQEVSKGEARGVKQDVAKVKEAQ